MQKSFTVHGPVQLDVRLPSGAVDVDATLEGQVEIELLASDEESQRLVDAARIELRETSGRTEVLVDVPPRSGAFGLATLFGRQGIGCRVRCPRGSDLRARTKTAEITAGPALGSLVPEPATIASLVALGALLRRRRCPRSAPASKPPVAEIIPGYACLVGCRRF